jgi:hypothetical protein
MTRYLSVIGDSWRAAVDWQRVSPSEPFLGIRFDGHETWVLFEPKTVDGPIRPALETAVRRAFEQCGSSYFDQRVFMCEAPTLASGYRLACIGSAHPSILMDGRHSNTDPLLDSVATGLRHRLARDLVATRRVHKAVPLDIYVIYTSQ